MPLPILAASLSALAAPLSALTGLILLFRTTALARTPGGVPGFWLAAALFWPPATLAWSDAPALALPFLAAWLTLPLAWLAGLDLARQARLKALVTGLSLALIVVLLAWALWQGPNTFTGKPQGPFNDPNAFAALLNLLWLPLLAGYLAADLAATAAWRRVAWLTLIGAALLVLALIASRGASLAALMVLPFLLWAARRLPQYRRKLVVLAVTAATANAAGTAVLLAHQTGDHALLRLAHTLQQGDTPRLQLNRAAWAMVQDHPWLGTGLGSFRLRYAAYRDPAETGSAGGWVHNDYLQLWLEGGLPMLLLLLGLCVWVGWRGFQALRTGGAQVVVDLGYVAGLMAILLHALVNFLLCFPLIMLLMGLYLARLSPVAAAPAATPARPLKLMASGYTLVVGLLLAGQVAVEGLIHQARTIQQALRPWGIVYPLYEVAWWLSVLSPWHPTPQQVMGLELADLARLTQDPEIIAEATRRMRMGRERVPCYLPFAIDAYRLLDQPGTPPQLRAQGRELVAESLRCNPRHGLTHYYAGRFEDSPDAARRWWTQGLVRSPYLPEHLLLAAALLRQDLPESAKQLDELAEAMAMEITRIEHNPGLRPDPVFWTEVQHRLQHLGGQRFVELVGKAGGKPERL